MKLAVTKKYINELQQQYCDEQKDYIPGYGVNRLFFNYVPQPRILFFNEDVITILTLKSMSLKVNNEFHIPLTPTTKIIFKKGVLMNKLKIYRDGELLFKTLLNRKIVGLGDIQKNCTSYLEKYTV